MRDIKFKAWDKNKKVFIPNEYWAIISTDFNAFGVMLKDWEDYREGEYFYENAQELSQFTGLLDKNGKEIYEFDILKDGRNRKGIVSFGEGEYTPDWWGVSWHGWYIDGIDTEFTQTEASKLEIIGNIYETPELLTK